MPWCPDCKTGYTEGMTNCADCDAKLVDQLETIPEQNSIDDFEYNESEVFLTSAANLMEYNIIKSLLESDGIITLRKTGGAGQYVNIMFGDTYTGYDVYVISSEFDRARDILEASILSNSGIEELDINSDFKNREEENSEEEYSVDNDETSSEIRTNFIKIGRWILILGFILGIIAFLYNMYYNK